jgi:hypothetical protein
MRFRALSDDLKTELRSTLPYEHIEIEVGLKYLGFYLKPNLYSFKDFSWLIKKI